MPGAGREALGLRSGVLGWSCVEGGEGGRASSGSTDGEGEAGGGVTGMQSKQEWAEENPGSA